MKAAPASTITNSAFYSTGRRGLALSLAPCSVQFHPSSKSLLPPTRLARIRLPTGFCEPGVHPALADPTIQFP